VLLLHTRNILTDIKNAKKREIEELANQEETKNENSNSLLGKKRKNDYNNIYKSEKKEKEKEKDEMDEFLYKPNIDLSDLGGMEEYVNEIKEIIGNPLNFYNLYKYMGIEHVKGILLCGPPGCGKTTIAHAIGGEYKIPFYKITAPQIISSLSGESENKIRKLFTQVEQNAPSILFIDEIESILGKRENASKEMEKRIVATITTCIDDLGSKSDERAPIFVIGATSKPEFIDSSVRRSGRFDKEIQIGFPNEIMREKMLKTLAKNKAINKEVEFLKLAKLTPGYLAADLESLMRESGRIAIKRILEENKDLLNKEENNLGNCVEKNIDKDKDNYKENNINISNSNNNDKDKDIATDKDKDNNNICDYEFNSNSNSNKGENIFNNILEKLILSKNQNYNYNNKYDTNINNLDKENEDINAIIKLKISELSINMSDFEEVFKINKNK
jgi:ribosome biogenesis ATPase